jgi:tetratricopeptide (TPR) repeat protein
MPLAVAYMLSGDFGSCSATAADVVGLEASNAQAHHMLGLCYLKLGRLADGAASLEEALQLTPESKDAAYTLATAYASANRIEDAERVQQQYLANSETSESYLVEAAIQKARREYGSAIKAAEKALRLNPALPMANELLGRSLVGLQMHPEAAEAYRRELSLDPNNFNANAVLGWIYLRDKRFDEAAPLLERAAKFRPNDVALLFMQAQVDDFRERYGEASRKLELVTAAQPDNRAAHVLLARAYAKLKRKEEFGREREIIRQLTEKEQERSLLRDDSYRGPQPSLPGEQ